MKPSQYDVLYREKSKVSNRYRKSTLCVANIELQFATTSFSFTSSSVNPSTGFAFSTNASPSFPKLRQNMNPVSEEAIEITSDFVSRTHPVRKSARLSSALLNYSRPDGINLVPLGSSQGLDTFARMHNGVRRELIDMYNMVDSMQRRIDSLRTSDIQSFFVWWDLFSSYLEVVFDCHEKLLWKSISPKDSGGEAVPASEREEMKQKLNSLLSAFDTIYNQLPRRPPDETMAKIIKGLIGMHPIVEYIEKIENKLPQVLEAHWNTKDIRKLERRIAHYLHKTGDSDFRKMHLLVMARAMTEEALSSWKKLLSPLLRYSYSSSSKRFASTHVGVVHKLAAE